MDETIGCPPWCEYRDDLTHRRDPREHSQDAGGVESARHRIELAVYRSEGGADEVGLSLYSLDDDGGIADVLGSLWTPGQARELARELTRAADMLDERDG